VSDLEDELYRALNPAYVVERELGRGGMATVYLARDVRHERFVALKVLRPDLGAALGAERFTREVRLAARLQHPHILSVYDSGQTPAGQLWFTMPYVEGESLRDRLRRDKQLSVESALRITRAVAGALAYAHQHGVIHRDIKPENILLTTQGDALLADFGIARALAAEAPAAGTLTGTGLAVGTPQYMSPEQAAGERDVTPQTDLYSLAAVCYEMLTGEPPFTGATAQAVIAKMMSSPAPSPRVARPAVSEPVDAAVRKALAPVPADRFATAADFAAALDSAERAGGSGASIQTTRAVGAAAGGTRAGRRFPVAAASLILGLLIGGGALFAWRSRERAQGGSGAKPSIAVLPFDNIGDSADAYFADGMTDEVRSKLTALAGLTVIAGASSDQYRHATKTPQQIARELGVRYLLVGKVRWNKHAGAGSAGGGHGSQSEVRVEPELMEVSDAATPTNKWEQSFDAPLTDVFAVQGQIAERVVQALHVALDTSQRAGLSARPTESLPAYEEYLRGNEATHHFTIIDGPFLLEAVAHYEKAVALDSTFALAWAGLARASIDLVYGGGTRAADRWTRGTAAAERAVSLAPDLPAAHLGLALSHMLHKEWAPAIEQLELGRRVAPDDPDLLTNEWEVNESEGRFDTAMVLVQHARRVDPRSGLVAFNLANALWHRRRCGEVDAALAPAFALAPHAPNLVAMQAWAQVCAEDMTGARDLLHAAIAHGDSAPLLAILTQYGGAFMLDAAGQGMLIGLRPADFDGQRALWASALAHMYRLRGDSAREHAYADTARAAATDALRTGPPEAQTLMALAYGNAMLGRRNEALQNGERSMALLPISRDAFNGSDLMYAFADVETMVGDADGAFAHLDTLVAMPSAISPGGLRLDPAWAPLRGDRRFERLIARASTPQH
jgi:serine/threonine-protein kinase